MVVSSPLPLEIANINHLRSDSLSMLQNSEPAGKVHLDMLFWE